MSDSYLYQLPSGATLPGPPVDLPKTEALRPPLRIDVSKPPASQGDPWAGSGVTFAAPSGRQAPSMDPWKGSGVEFSAAEDEPPHKEISTAGAFAQSLAHGAAFGLSPAIAGATAAGREGIEQQQGEPGLADVMRQYGHEPVLGELIRGLGRLGYGHLIAPALGLPADTTEADQAYDRGRAEAQADLDAGREQHPWASMAGEMGGAVLTPVPGIGAAASIAGRIGRGALTGAGAAGAYGAGSAISEGKDSTGILQSAVTDALVGAGLGGVIGGAFGPRVVNPNTPGQAAARTAESLGRPLPRGVASDSRMVQATTSKLRQMPFGGERIGEAVDETAHAAGEHIDDIASTMAGGSTDRAAADLMVKPGLQNVINQNRNFIDASYNGVRSLLNLRQRYTMPRTSATLNRIASDRAGAGWPNPEQGLEQFRNVSRGATFNGAHRARMDAREAGNALVPHPGYNAADWNQLARAMTADLRDIVRASGGRNANRALAEFDAAETDFRNLSQVNDLLHHLVQSRGEGAIASLLGAAQKKGGNLRLLAQLRNSMPAADFAQIGGTLLGELGHTPNGFGLARFVSNWDRVSDRAKAVLFSPQHLRDIEDVVGMGQHIRGALRESSTSHSASGLVLLEVAKDALGLGVDIMAGTGGIGTAVSGATSAGAWLLMRWLASPATARSMGAWTRAYRAATLGQATPARTAVFNVATRNLAQQIGVSPSRILAIVQGSPAIRAEDENAETPRVIDAQPNKGKADAKDQSRAPAGTLH